MSFEGPLQSSTTFLLPRAPRVISNRFRVIEELGSGMSGSAILVADLQSFDDTKYVLKKLDPSPALPPAVRKEIEERFDLEADQLRRLNQYKKQTNQIPRITGKFAYDGDHYLILEYIEGKPLSQKLQEEGPFSEDFVIDFLLKMLPVLKFIHSKVNPPLIHRDIKPSNIIWRKSDNKPVLVDFGAVKEIRTSLKDPTTIAIGTPGFCPAEQAAGKPCPASDIYALGITALVLLSNQLEVSLSSLTARDLPRDLGISKKLAEILSKATRTDLSERYKTAERMARDLRPLASRQRASIPPQNPRAKGRPAFATQHGRQVVRTPFIATSPFGLFRRGFNLGKYVSVALILISLVLFPILFKQDKNRGKTTSTTNSPNQIALSRGSHTNIHGSNTINEKLLPDLIQNLLESLGYTQIRQSRDETGKILVKARMPGQSETTSVEICPDGTEAGIKYLKGGNTHLLVASRFIKPTEIGMHLKGQAIGVDPIAIIVSERNPVDSLTIELLEKIFSRKIEYWDDVPGWIPPPGTRGRQRINLYARDDSSGTSTVFGEQVLKDKGLLNNAERISSSEELARKVSHDDRGIGFVGLPHVGVSKVLKISRAEGFEAVLPGRTTVEQGRYPITRPLYLYIPADSENPLARALLSYAVSQEGQVVINKAGFIGRHPSKLEAGSHLEPEPNQTFISHPGFNLHNAAAFDLEKNQLALPRLTLLGTSHKNSKQFSVSNRYHLKVYT